MVVNWYKFFSKDKKSIYNKSLEQINHYRDLVYKKETSFNHASNNFSWRTRHKTSGVY